MTPATAAAVSLLERLRTLAEMWDGAEAPGLFNLPATPEVPRVVSEALGFTAAVAKLSAAEYYGSRRSEWVPRINAAIAALKETT